LLLIHKWIANVNNTTFQYQFCLHPIDRVNKNHDDTRKV
jgi:hypothetical protein